MNTANAVAGLLDLALVISALVGVGMLIASKRSKS